MWIKLAIAVLLAALLISLGSGLVFLAKDKGRSRRTVRALGTRVTLAAALMALLFYGVCSGEFRSRAPWDQARPAPEAPPTN